MTYKLYPGSSEEDKEPGMDPQLIFMLSRNLAIWKKLKSAKDVFRKHSFINWFVDTFVLPLPE